MSFEAITTQEAFDAAIKERMERQKKSVTEEVTKKYTGWVSPEDVEKKTKEHTDRIAELEGKLKTAEESNATLTAESKKHATAAAKMRIAHEVGLPMELADRLTGDTDDDIRKDAETLSKLSFGAHSPSPSYSGEKPVPENTTTAAFQSMLNDLKK